MPDPIAPPPKSPAPTPTPPASPPLIPELARLDDDLHRRANWKRWGPYLAERQWGTVREDYSDNGDCWNYLPHDHARSRAYRWGEDGLLGICDREGRLNFSVALWNGRDPILKERLFGLSGPEGNHGEDVKELYYYLDSSPTHSYMRALYKYPQEEYPYKWLVDENRRRGKLDREFEITDTGIFDQKKYFDVFAEYAKAQPDDLLIKLTVVNRGPESATLHLLPTLWFSNTWTWGCTHEGCDPKPWMQRDGATAVRLQHATLGMFRFEFQSQAGAAGQAAATAELLFTENETNTKKLFGVDPVGKYVKDAFHSYIVNGIKTAVNPAGTGTKLAMHYGLTVPAGASITVQMRLYPDDARPADALGASFGQIFSQRQKECDDFYKQRFPAGMTQQELLVARQATAGLLWCKQFYKYVVADWLDGDPNEPPVPPGHKHGRNRDWRHLFSRDVISMPDSWEYPWFAMWDLSFHMICFARLDPEFTKHQLVLLLREWYMAPNGQLPAYEFAFGDVNPPVHAWACWRTYKMTAPRGQRDTFFLERSFQKLLINFTWWVNRKDVEGKNIFGGGFLGLDNIGVFDRSKPLPNGASLEQADGTAWMAFYCGTMLSMALELARTNKAYEDIASKFFEHFIAIVDAMNTLGGTGLWDEADGFYYDQLQIDGRSEPMRVRSIVGVIPLIACEVLNQSRLEELPGFNKRMRWFLEHRKDLARHITFMTAHVADGTNHCRMLLAVPSRERLGRVLRYVLDETEFFSPYGVRSVSEYHKDHPFVTSINGQQVSVNYEPGESESYLFGGNSNWRGPIWFPINFLLIEALERYYYFYGDDFQIECPVNSGKKMNLQEVSRELSRRLSNLFLPDASGQRPCHGEDRRYADDPNYKDLVLFYEHFHGDTGRGIGASHQTGWTALAGRILESLAKQRQATTAGKQ
jgi:hypothetical protein